MTVRYDQAGAFGNPDGSREDFSRFIDLVSEGLDQVNPVYVDRNISHRVIVGAKGSGKTLYMRKMEADASESGSILVIKQSGTPPTTDSILSIHRMYEDKIRTEQWSFIWRRAIFLSVASQYYCSKKKDPKLNPELLMSHDEFHKEFKNLAPEKFLTPHSIFSQVSFVIQHHGHSYNQLAHYLEDSRWDSFESIVIELLLKSPPLVYFIDAIDEELRHAPAAWLDFQKGLFYQVMKLLRNSEIGGRLHVIICIRDLVFSSVLQSEHASRYIKDEHIKILHWSRTTAREFLRKKIKALDKDLFISKNKEKTLANLIGYSEIRNKKRGITENLEDYILRHTRHFPRDIINIGNSVCQEIKSQKDGRRPLDPNSLIECVADISGQIARETISVCGNNLAASSLPGHAVREDILLPYAENPIIADQMRGVIYSFIRELGKDQFDYDTLLGALIKYQNIVAKHAEKNKFEQYRLDTVLWQHGLIGYKNNKRDKTARFKNSSPTETFALPANKACYVLHGCLIDEVSPLEYKRGNPIVCE